MAEAPQALAMATFTTVFLSSTARDLQPYRDAVYQAGPESSEVDAERGAPLLIQMPNPDLADRLIGETTADLDSPAEWERAQRFFYNALWAVRAYLPEAAQKQLVQRSPKLPAKADLEVARVALWQSIEADPMGNTPEGAAVRATLFAFFPPESDGPLDAVALFCAFFGRAGLPEAVLVQAFQEQWP